MTTARAPRSIDAAAGSRSQTAAPPLPDFDRLIPAQTARRYRAWSAVWLAAATVAVAAKTLAAPLWLQAAAAGLMLPGGGQFATGHSGWGVVAAVGVLLAVVVWWVLGIVFLPPLAWLGAAAAAALVVDRDIAPGHLAAVALVLPVAGTVAFLVHRVRHGRQRAAGRAINERLAGVTFSIPSGDVAARVNVTELTGEDLEFQRYALDLALQPIDRFEGFAHFDQFREAALRYQLFFLGYALSQSQYNCTPAFSGYLAEAQRNAIEKVLDRKVWGYWALENAWGRLSLRRDPVDTTGNVMLTGYYGTQIGMYESLNDARFSVPGALNFRWSGSEHYRHDLGSIADSVVHNARESDFALFSCEPNWIYPMCNAFGLTTLVARDRLHGSSDMSEQGARMRRAYETEFLRPDGRMIGMRSKHLGLTWNLWTGAAVQLTTALWLNASMPEFAHRAWWLLRSEFTFEDGLLKLPTSVSTKLDPGNYTFGTDHYALSITEATAREMGDTEIADAARRTLEATSTVVRRHGAAKYEGMSPFTSMYSLMARTLRRGSMRDLIAFGAPEHWATGPRLAEAAYPEVLVAQASTDGDALSLVLRPGVGPTRTRLRIDRLLPHGEYRVDDSGQILRADAAGQADLVIDLDARRALSARPQ